MTNNHEQNNYTVEQATRDLQAPVASQRLALGTGKMERLPVKDANVTASQSASSLTSSSDELSLATLPDATFLVDANGEIVDANPHAELLIGYSRDELVGRPVSDFVARLEPAARTDTAEHRDHARFVSANMGAIAHHRSGRTIAVEVLLCPHEQGQSLAIVRPSEADTAGLRDDDVAQIVHDLKNPLSTIALESQLLDLCIERLDQDAMCAAVHRILLNVEFLDRMVQDLLDLCAIDAGKLVLHRKPTELRTLIEGVLERIVATRDRGRVFFEGAEHIIANLDELRIQRVLANLIQNALKYAPRGSGIVVRLSLQGRFACVSVLDAGPGVADAEQALIFEKYRRARGAAEHSGNGLGLYVSKRIIEAHQGRIGVETLHGAGSRFFFELPLT